MALPIPDKVNDPRLKSRALRVDQDCILTAAFGRFTFGPATRPKVYGSVHVGVSSKAARTTGELRLRRAICFIDMSASRALSRRVTWVHLDQRNPSEECFVGDLYTYLHSPSLHKSCIWPSFVLDYMCVVSYYKSVERN